MSLVPDASAFGLTGVAPDPLRYGSGDADPNESVGILRSFIPDGARILDVGCGTGGSTRTMTAGKTDQVVCVEPDPMRAAAARDRGFEVYCDVFDEQFASKHGKFDAIVFGDILEHLSDPAKAVALAHDCLSPDGAILVSVPNVAHWTIRVKLLFGRFDYTTWGLMDATHLRWFTRRTLTSMLERQGFRITDFRVSSGTWMTVYRTPPFRVLPDKAKAGLIGSLASSIPTLFGAQHVVRAVPIQ